MAAKNSVSKIAQAYRCQLHCRRLPFSSSFSSYTSNSSSKLQQGTNYGSEDDAIPTSGISKPLSDILKELNKKVPESLISSWTDPHGVSVKYVPWHVLNRILNLHAPEWSGEVRSITYSADGNSVSVVYRVTLYGTDAEIYREATGTASVSDTNYGDGTGSVRETNYAVQKAEAMAFRRACARLGLGLYLYHEDLEDLDLVQLQHQDPNPILSVIQQALLQFYRASDACQLIEQKKAI